MKKPLIAALEAPAPPKSSRKKESLPDSVRSISCDRLWSRILAGLQLLGQLQLGVGFFFPAHIPIRLTQQVMGRGVVRVHVGGSLQGAHGEIEFPLLLQYL